MRISPLAVLAAMVLAFAFVGGARTAAAPEDTFDKDAFLSRKKWYVTFTVRLKGIGEVNRPSKRNNDPSYRKESWDILREVSGVVELDQVLPGTYPSSHLPTDPAALVSMLSERGRFIGWMNTTSHITKGDLTRLARGDSKMAGSTLFIPVSYTVNDLVRYESASMGEAGLISKFWGTKKIKGAGTAYMLRVGAGLFACDLKEMKFDLRLENARKAGSGIKGDAPDVKIEEETHARGPGDDDDQELPPKTEKPDEFLPGMTETLREQLLWRNLEVHGDKIAFTVFERVKAFPFGADRRITGGPPLELSMDVLISPSPPSRARLILKPVGYDKWRPRCAGAEDEKGNDLQVVWRVEDEGGKGTTLSKVKRVVFELADVSQEPGVCMNWPIEPKTPAPPDLKFAGGTAAGRSVQAEGQKLVLTDAAAGAASGSLTVDCFDAGATGVLVAEATLDDGRVIHATVETSGEASLRIPDFEPGTRIAKFWREKNAPGKRDNADDEVEPKGDGQPGDGLTVYEEYRGFWVFARWDGTCEPKIKDLFIFNKVGDLATQGIQLFAGATGLKVHDLLQGDEAKADRVINFNMDGRDHLVDQHCLVVVPGGFTNKDDDGEVVSAGSRIVSIKDAEFGGPPKNTEYVTFLPSMLGTHPMEQRRNGEIYRVSSGEYIVAHELGHAVGIRHHGDKDTGNRKWTYRLNDDGTIRVLSDGSEITVLDEKTGQPVTRDRVFPGLEPGKEGVYWIGERNGQMSGDDACVMRYVNATTYRSMTDSSVLYYFGYAEIMGVRLCDSPAGTGVNMPTHKPQSRYFGADSGRGNCVHRFVISDHWEKLK